MSTKTIAPPSFTKTDVKVSRSEQAYSGFFKVHKLQLRHRLFEGGWSPTITREIFDRGSAVAAVMYDPKNKLIGLIEQFRVGALDLPQGPWLLEVVAGMTEKGESPEEVILRELQEEAQMTPVKLLPICNYLSSPGGSDEELTLFCALGDLTEISGIHGHPDEGENIRALVLPEETVFDQLYNGRFNNAATLICLQWLRTNCQKLKEYSDDAE
jgi:ADP-ribose pyrophosphatase